MAPPPSDKEIIDTFTDKERELHEWYENNSDALDRLSSEEWDDYMDKKFPTSEAWEEFMAFGNKWFSRSRHRLAYQMTVGEFFDKVKATNFTSLDSVSSFNWTMEMLNTPFVYIGVGSHQGNVCGYGINTGSSYLWPNYDQKPWETNILDYGVLGINTSIRVEYESNTAPVGSSHKRRLNRSSGEDSVRSTETDDAEDANGFLFVQLGALCRFSGDWAKASKSDNDKILQGPWEDTGFGVVAELNKNGFLGDILVIYNFFGDFVEMQPTKKPDANLPVFKKEHIEVRDAKGDKLHHIGRVHPDATGCFTRAVIANNIDKLRTPRYFKFDLKATEEYQIVRVVLRGGQGGQGPFLVRQVVAKDPDAHQSRRMEVVQR